MDERVKTVVRQLSEALQQELVTLPDAVQALIEARVERCHTDFATGTTTYYMPDGSFEITPARIIPAVADFRGEAVKEIVQANDQGEIGYRVFCDRLAAAGCVGYFVSLAGRRSVYYARTLAAHIEWFGPPAGIIPPGPPPSRRAR